MRVPPRAACSYADQPIPFTYVHLIYFIAMMYLPLFSYAMARGLQARALNL